MSKKYSTMKKILFILLICQIKIYGQAIPEIFNLTPIIDLPYSTNNIKIKNFPILNKYVVYKDILFNDTGKIKYSFYEFSEDEKNVLITKNYNFLAIAKYEFNNKKFLIYNRGGNDSGITILRIYNYERILDSIVIRQKIGEEEIIKYSTSEIDKNLKITTTTYEFNPVYKQNRNAPNAKEIRTQATITRYQIDSITGKINLLSEQKMYSDCIPEEFTYKDSKCVLHP